MSSKYLFTRNGLTVYKTFHTSSTGLAGRLHLFIQRWVFTLRSNFTLVRRVDTN